jgi:hypothetical protein
MLAGSLAASAQPNDASASSSGDAVGRRDDIPSRPRARTAIRSALGSGTLSARRITDTWQGEIRRTRESWPLVRTPADRPG